MVVEVDDSGWGDLIGGVVIVMRRVETGEKYVDEIPLELFQGEEFKYQTYLRYTTQIILDGLDELEVPITEPIHICTGYIFKKAKETLNELGYFVKEVKIMGRTQELAEEEFLKSLEKIGVGMVENLRDIRSFNGFLNWVREDIEKRENYVKTGWKRWKEHRESPK
ncbi:hypothetical protein GF319_15255 [Candidatus Bathyarchaeota archaeon]|jgi:hypothetical protein|nr:hypothetical protein [Candidatus Bathyarchaeota archaeon]